LELLVARDEIGLAVDLDEDADLAAGVDVRADEAFVRRAFLLLLGLEGARFLKDRGRLLVVAAGLHQGVAAIDHAGAGGFAKRLDVAGGGFVRGFHQVATPRKRRRRR
jgi:hypothetical protein